MELEFAFLADAAQVSEGKLYVLGGGIDRVWAAQFPATHPALALVVKVRLHPTECNRPHQLEVQLWDSDGKHLAEIKGGFSVPTGPGARPAFVQMVLNFVNQQFPHPGDYDFHIVVDGQHLKTVPLNLHLDQKREAPPAPPPAASGPSVN